MRYVGGKQRQAKDIARVLLALGSECHTYLEPFVGGASVLAEVSPFMGHSIAADISLDLVLFWCAVQDGWRPPASLTKDEYDALREGPPSPMRAWAGYAASYNGRWWGGYGPMAPGRDYLAESLRAVDRKASGFHNVSWRACDYEEHATVRDGWLVYCDPPYINTGGHRGLSNPGAVGYTDLDFDHDRFWQVMNEWVAMGAQVVVSEYEAPPGWTASERIDRTETMNHRDQSSGKRDEVLWVPDAF